MLAIYSCGCLSSSVGGVLVWKAGSDPSEAVKGSSFAGSNCRVKRSFEFQCQKIYLLLLASTPNIGTVIILVVLVVILSPSFSSFPMAFPTTRNSL